MRMDFQIIGKLIMTLILRIMVMEILITEPREIQIRTGLRILMSLKMELTRKTLTLMTMI